MKKLLIVLILVLISVPAIAERDFEQYWPKVSKKKLGYVQRKTVVLYVSQGDVEVPFCSGFIAKNKRGKTKIWTAQHCCLVWNNLKSKPIYKTFDEKRHEGRSYDMDSFGTDTCRVDPIDVHRTKLKISRLKMRHKFLWQRDKFLWLVTNYPRFRADPDLLIQKAYRISAYDEDTRYMMTSVISLGGMSGSPIVDRHLRVVGIHVAVESESNWPIGYYIPFANTSYLE